MEHSTLEIPQLRDLLEKLEENDTQDRHFLPDEVRFSDLRRMSDANLAGRLASYERDYTFELNKQKREEFYREVIRSKIELSRRAYEERTKAVEAALVSSAGRADIEAANDAEANWQRVTKVAA